MTLSCSVTVLNNVFHASLWFSQISISGHKLTSRVEGGLISSLHLLLCVIPYLSDSTLMDVLEVSQLL